MKLHHDAVHVLGAWAAPSPEQESLRRRYIRHLAGHPDAMRRTCHPDHLTASAIILSPDGRWALLTLHRKLERWLQTGGHCEDEDMTLAGAASREAREESGLCDISTDPDPLVLSMHRVPCGPIRPARHLDVQFLVTASRDAAPIVSEESLDVRWFAVDALPESADRSVRELIAAGNRRLAEKRWPAPSSDTERSIL